MSVVFNQIFGGNNLVTAQPTFLALNPLTTNVVLQWPLEQTSSGVNVVADIVEVNATSGGLSVSLTDARQTSTGYTALFNNIGANTFSVLDASGNSLASIASGTVWQLYLADNSTFNGTWRVFQFGAGVSNANAAALAGAGLKAITTTLNERILINSQNANYAIVNSDRANCIEWTGGNGTFTLPSPGTVGSDWFCIIKNSGTGSLTVTPPSGTIDAAASLTFNPDNSAFVVCDGTNFFTVGLGQAINSIFDFDSIDLTGVSGNYVLAGANLNRISYRFTGAIAGNVNVIVPNTVQQYWVDNETTGAFGLTVKTLAGTGTSVTQGGRNILYCDGTNVVAAVTFNSTGFPDGSAAAPSISFASHPTTGFYLAGADVLGMSTAGTERLQIDALGHVLVESASDTGASFTVNGPGGGPGIGAIVKLSQGGTASSPALQLLNTAGSGTVTLSLSSNNAAAGTTDLSIFQNGSSGDGEVLNRHATGHLKLGANSIVGIDIDQAGVPNFPLGLGSPAGVAPALFATTDHTQGFGLGASGPVIYVGNTDPGHTFTFSASGSLNIFSAPTGSMLIASSPVCYHDNGIIVSNGGVGGSTGLTMTASNGASASAGAATLPANPVGFFIWQLNGTNVKVPYYAN